MMAELYGGANPPASGCGMGHSRNRWMTFLNVVLIIPRSEGEHISPP
jgi:hypothetical protein